MTYEVKLETRDDELWVVQRTFENENARKVIKGWESFSGWFWFALEETNYSVGNKPVYFGYVQGTYEEYGNFSQYELDQLIQRGMVWELDHITLALAGRR